MHIIDTIISREGKNSPWVNVVFLGASGESISVRLPCAVPPTGEGGRGHIIKRAAKLLRGMVACEDFNTLGEPVWSVPTGRFGAPLEAPLRSGEELRSLSRTSDD